MAGVNGALGVALFGVGRAGQIHLNNVIRNRKLHLRWIVEIEACAKTAEKLVEENVLQGTTTVTTWERSDAVFSDEKVKFVIVTTPTREHEKVVRRALEAGKGVFCEKPIALTQSSTKALYEEAQRLGVPLFCCFQRRFDPGFSSLKEKVSQGAVGRVLMVTTFSRDSPLPSLEYLRISGGVFHDCGVHDIDLMCWIIGEAPSSVFVRASVHKKEIGEFGDVDSAAIVLNFPSGVIGTIHLSRHSTFYDQRLEVHGDKGVLYVGNPPTNPLEYGDSLGVHSAALHYSFPQRYRVAYAAELDHFISVLTKKTPQLLIQCEDTLLASRVASACDKSLKTGLPATVE